MMNEVKSKQVRAFLGTVLIILLCAACGSNKDQGRTVKTETTVGKVMSAKYVPETFTTWAKTELETDQGIFVLNGTVSIIKGDEATLRTLVNGKKYICFESFDPCRHVWGT